MITLLFRLGIDAAWRQLIDSEVGALISGVSCTVTSSMILRERPAGAFVLLVLADAALAGVFAVAAAGRFKAGAFFAGAGVLEDEALLLAEVFFAAEDFAAPFTLSLVLPLVLPLVFRVLGVLFALAVFFGALLDLADFGAVARLVEVFLAAAALGADLRAGDALAAAGFFASAFFAGGRFVADALAPDAFVPDAFVPEAFVPDAFVPEAFVPVAFLPDAFALLVALAGLRAAVFAAAVVFFGAAFFTGARTARAWARDSAAMAEADVAEPGLVAVILSVVMAYILHPGFEVLIIGYQAAAKTYKTDCCGAVIVFIQPMN